MIHSARSALALLLLGLAAQAARGEETRIAVWSFSAAAEDAEGVSLGQRLASLTEAELARRGCDIVERRGIERVLKEHKLAFTQFADAKKAVRAGKLARADIVLVGTVLKRGKGRLVTMKAVETASGKVLDARARAVAESRLRECASDAAEFVAAARGKDLGERVFLAVGGFEDLSVNDRFKDLGRELRSALSAVFRDDQRIRLVEREHVEPLLLELGLSKSGLASPGFGKTDAVPAFLVVDGLYQSYRAEETGITLNLRFERLGQPLKVVQVDEKPGPPLFRAAAGAIRKFLAGAKGKEPVPAAKRAEAEIHFKRGCEHARIGETDKPYPSLGGPHGGYFRSDEGYRRTYPREAKRLENLMNAISSFESAILLDPPNYRAKLYLAACLSDPDVSEFERARRLMQEVIAGASEKRLRDLATVRLGQTYIDAHADHREPKDEAIRKELGSDFRQAIDIWLKFAQEIEQVDYRYRVVTMASAALERLWRYGLASAEECACLAKKQAELNCRLQLLRWERSIRVHAYSFFHYWQKIRIFHTGYAKPVNTERLERARAECLSLAEELSARFPPLSYQLRFTLAEEFGMTEENLALAEKAADEAIDHPEGKVGLPNALVDMLPKVIVWNAEFARWKKAAHYADVLAEVTRKNGGVRVSPLSRARFEILRARCYEELGQWEEALAVYRGVGDLEVPVPLRNFGPVVLVGKAMRRCRWRLGLEGPPEEAPSRALGASAVTLPKSGFRPARISSLAAVGRALWIGARPHWATPYKEKRAPSDTAWADVGGLYRYEPSTGALKKRELTDESAARWITTLATMGNSIYVGTYGAGLFRLDVLRGTGRRWTTEDGFPNDCVGCISAWGDRRLLIGFGRTRFGGCGWIDVPTEKYFGYSPRLGPGETEAPRLVTLSISSLHAPPRRAVTGIGSSSEGTLWVAVSKKGLQRYGRETGQWHTARGRSDFGRVSKKGEWCITDNKENLTCLAVGEGFVAVGAGDTGSRSGTSFQAGSVDIYYPMSGTWRHVRRSEGLPDASVYSLAVQGKTLWIGGKGYVAAYDLEAEKLRLVYTVPGNEKVEALCVDGQGLWVGAGNKVYRIERR